MSDYPTSRERHSATFTEALVTIIIGNLQYKEWKRRIVGLVAFRMTEGRRQNLCELDSCRAEMLTGWVTCTLSTIREFQMKKNTKESLNNKIFPLSYSIITPTTAHIWGPR